MDAFLKIFSGDETNVFYAWNSCIISILDDYLRYSDHLFFLNRTIRLRRIVVEPSNNSNSFDRVHFNTLELIRVNLDERTLPNNLSLLVTSTVSFAPGTNGLHWLGPSCYLH